MSKKETGAADHSMIEKSMNIDDIFINDPDGYAAKFTQIGRKIIIAYLNTRPMAQVEPFFVSMFEIDDKDPFFRIEWIKKIFDYLKNSCPRGEARDIIMNLAQNTVLYKTNKKVEDDASEQESSKETMADQQEKQ